jgi:hypothetical protein
VQVTGEGKNPLFAEKVNLFFLKVVDAQLEFFRGSDGKMASRTLPEWPETGGEKD